MNGPVDTNSELIDNILPSQQKSVAEFSPTKHVVGGEAARTGVLILNADDWGRDHHTTDRIFECVLHRTVSSVSAMVFMQDSERAAKMALSSGIDAGLHLNFSLPFSSPRCPRKLLERQDELGKCLRKHPLSRVLFHPSLARSFEYVVAAQLDEYCRIYGASATRIDGHHHLHLCTNVLVAELLPAGTLVRRNFSFQPGEKSLCNRLYRKTVDSMLARRHALVDFLFSLVPLDLPGRLEKMISVARQHVVEVETHPVNAEEYQFLTGPGILRCIGNMPIASRFLVDESRYPGRSSS